MSFVVGCLFWELWICSFCLYRVFFILFNLIGMFLIIDCLNEFIFKVFRIFKDLV